MSTTRKEFGKITNVVFGYGGYQDAQFGLSLSFEGKGWGCGTFIAGGWSLDITADEYAKWTEEDRIRTMGEMVLKVNVIMQKAKVHDVTKLLNKPVEVTFESNTLKDWRIFEEVL